MQPSGAAVTVDSFRRSTTSGTTNQRKVNKNSANPSFDNTGNVSKQESSSTQSSKNSSAKSYLSFAFYVSRIKIIILYIMYCVLIILLLAVYLICTRCGLFPIYIRTPGPSSTSPLLPESALEVVATLPVPSGNIAISDKGRLFFTFHPEYHSHPSYPYNVAELTSTSSFGSGIPMQYSLSNGSYAFSSYRPFPTSNFQRSQLHSVLSLRIDHLDRLWLLDFAWHGLVSSKRPQLLAFQLLDASNLQQNIIKEQTPVIKYTFPSYIAGFGSFLNDFAVDRDGFTVYIADTSLLAQTPALIVFRSDCLCAFRVLQSHSALLGRSVSFSLPSFASTGVSQDTFKVGGYLCGLLGFKMHFDSIALTYHTNNNLHNNNYSPMNSNNINNNNPNHATIHNNLKRKQKQLLQSHLSRVSRHSRQTTSHFNNNIVVYGDFNDQRHLSPQHLSLDTGHLSPFYYNNNNNNQQEVISERRLYLAAMTGSDMFVIPDLNIIHRLCANFNLSSFLDQSNNNNINSNSKTSKKIDPHRHREYFILQKQLQRHFSDVSKVKRASGVKPIVTDGLSVSYTSTGGAAVLFLTDVVNSAVTLAFTTHHAATHAAHTNKKTGYEITQYVKLIQSKQQLQWPDGLTFGSDGSLYVTVSHLHSEANLGVKQMNTSQNSDKIDVKQEKRFHILRVSGKTLSSVTLPVSQQSLVSSPVSAGH